MIHSKLPHVGTSIFSVMTQMAVQHNAINLSQGFPDFPVSEKLIELVNRKMKDGYNQYAPMPGVMALREAISNKIEKLHGVTYDPESEINITAGATQGISATIAALINEGDEVIIFEPSYDSYVPSVRLHGGKPVFVQMTLPDYRIDWEQVKKAINAQTKMIILNSPHNPSGSVLSREDLETLRKIVQGTRIIILSDEVYEHMVFDGLEHESVCRIPELQERSIIVSSFGKTFHATGWKIGYVVAPKKFMAEFRKLHQFDVYTVNTPIQYALVEFLKYEEEYLQLSSFYQQKRDHFIGLLGETKFKFVPSQGTYFQNVNYSEISEISDKEFAEWLTKEVGVAAIPLSAFYHQKLDYKMIRFCFAKSEQTMDKAISLLKKIE